MATMLVASEVGRLRRVLLHRPDLPAVRVLTTGGDSVEAEREQWDDGNNVLAVAPGVVVACPIEREPAGGGS